MADPLASTHVPVPTLGRPREQVTVTFFYYTLPGEMGSWKKDIADWTTMFDNANWESKHYVEGSWAFKVEESLGKDWEKKVSGGVCVNIASICTNRCTHPRARSCAAPKSPCTPSRTSSLPSRTCSLTRLPSPAAHQSSKPTRTSRPTCVAAWAT